MSETFRCPVCGTTSFHLRKKLRDRVMRTMEREFRLVACTGCGLQRLHPQPDAETLALAYGPDYAPHTRPGISGKAKGWLERRSVRHLRAWLGNPARVLDVGCATGDLLLAIKARGNPNVAGVEPGAEASRIARSRGLDVFTGELEEADFPDESFDTVLASHTLEHVSDPLAFLQEVHRILAPGGAVILWLPNADSFEAAIFRRFWIGYDPPRHLTTFTVGTLGRTLQSAGFEVEEVHHEAVGLEWAWGVRLAIREVIPPAERVLSKIHPLLIVAFTPLAWISSRRRRSGRIRVIARKM